MNRPKIKIEKNALDKSIEILTFLLVVISAVLIGIYYNQLPEKLPIYFSWPSKDKNGFGTKDVLWAIPIIHGVIVIVIYKLNKNPWIFNYPIEVNENNAKFNYKMATQMLRIIGLIIGFMCLSLTLSCILSGLGNTTELDNYFEPLFPILLVVIPMFYIVKILLYRINSKEGMDTF